MHLTPKLISLIDDIQEAFSIAGDLGGRSLFKNLFVILHFEAEPFQ
jgi:hypothetical protein